MVKEAARFLALAEDECYSVKTIKTLEELPQADQTSVLNFLSASLRVCSTLQNGFSLTTDPPHSYLGDS